MAEETRVESRCVVCTNVDVFFVPSSGLVARGQGLTIERAFPEIPEERRVQLARHICPNCQQKEKEAAEK